MKVFAFAGVDKTGNTEIPDGCNQVHDLEIRSLAVFEALMQKMSGGGITKIVKPFQLQPNIWGFIWLALPEQQGSHEHFLVLCGDWDAALLKKATISKEECKEFYANHKVDHLSPAWHAAIATLWIERLAWAIGVDAAGKTPTAEDYKKAGLE